MIRQLAIRSLRFFALALALTAGTQVANTTSADEAGMLWRVAGMTNSVYLVGSVHMLRESDFPLPGRIEAAYTDAEALVMELDMDDLNPLVVQGLFFTLGTLGADETLAEVMGAANWQQASTAAEALGIDLAMLNRVKPWRAAITIAQLQLAKMGFDPELGLESYFLRRAKQDDKPIAGLETAAFQLGLFDSMSKERQVQMLLKSLEDAATMEQDMAVLLNAWRAGQDDALNAIQVQAFEGFPALYATLIKQRNNNWVNVLAALLDDEQDYLVVVGALHLVGADGVPARLAELGYEVVKQ